MNLSENIRYCTMLPSIEAYPVGNYPIRGQSQEPPEPKTYTVAEFASEVLNDLIRAPFAPERGKNIDVGRKSSKHKHSSTDDSFDLDAKEWNRKWDELFGTSG